MPLYRLKAGSHVVGTTGVDKDGNPTEAVIYVSNDPTRNIVPSDKPLDEEDPARFELYRGPEPEFMAGRRQRPVMREPLPPRGPGPAEVAAAQEMRPMTPDEMLAHADQLARRAEDLRRRAEESRASAERGAAEQERVMKETGGQPPIQIGATGQPVQEAPQGRQAGPQQKPRQEGSEKDLEDMTVEELRALAEEEEIDLPSNARKADIIATIRRSRKED
jgi:hypothetical protein